MKLRTLRTLAMTLVMILGLSFCASALAEGFAFPWQQGELGIKAKERLITKIKLTKKTGTITINNTMMVQTSLRKFVQITPSNATNKVLLWTSSDDSTATVDENGTVTATKDGVVIITVASTDGSEKAAQFTLTINPIEVASLGIGDYSTTLNAGQKYSIQPTIKPSNATYQEFKFESDNPSVASVTERGEVTTYKTGIANITISFDKDFAKKNNFRVQVKGQKLDTLLITAVGDLVVGGDPTKGTLRQFMNHLNRYQKDYGHRWIGMMMKPAVYFREDDITLGNLEVTINDGAGSRRYKEYTFRGNPEYLNILKNASVDVVNTANNHTKDFGAQSYEKTKNYLNQYNQKFNGHGLAESLIMEVKGVKIGFIGFLTITKPTELIASEVRQLKDECDVVIVSMHNIDVPKYQFKVSSKQREYAHAVIDNGADLVVMHHPHVLSGLESYKGKTIAYDLGNFLSAGTNPIRSRNTIILRQKFDVYEGFVEPAGVEIVPFWISTTDKINNFQPSYPPAKAIKPLLAQMDRYSVGTPVEYTVVEDRTQNALQDALAHIVAP